MYNISAPLYDALAKHIAQGRASFHTPGHKGHADILDKLDIINHDLTELPDTASLYDGGDAIEQAEKLAAQTFGAELTLFSAGGCTLCIQTMLLLGAGAGSHVLFTRNSHRSAVHAAALLGLKPVWAWPSPNGNGQITPQDIENTLSSDSTIHAVYITSPDYYGNLADIPAIANICAKAKIPLLVDNAHGSHLGAFGLHPLALGADMTADSAHKTLPVLTGGAMLHIGNTNKPTTYDRQTAKAAMALFGSTSPGFPVLASLDLARNWWINGGTKAYQKTAIVVKSLIRTAVENGIRVLDNKLHDPTRLTLDTSSINIDGIHAAAYFRLQGCEPEYADAHFVVFIITPFNTQEDLKRLELSIRNLSKEYCQYKLSDQPISPPYNYSGSKPLVAMTPRDALMCPCETVAAADSIGRISARAVCPCPPGIAAVVPGEIIDHITAQKLSLCGFKKLVVLKHH